METETNEKRRRSALFVDFDNIYLGLKQLDEAAAERFANDPARWISWMESGMPKDEDSDADSLQKRDLLIRRCYLNPRDFHRYRPNFTRAAFNVIDCPSLTSQGKNSADIYMVMDIIDALEHKTNFDEFVILSGDADFTPVLLRLRAYARDTAILAAGPASEAYKAACNLVIQEDDFIEYALGMSADLDRQSTVGPVSATPDEVLEAMAAKLYAEASADGEILATDLPKLYLNFPEFRRDSNWLGFFSLRALTVDLARRHPALRITEGDPWRVTVSVPKRRTPSQERAAARNGSAARDDRLRQDIVQRVRQMVAAASEPILMAKAAHEIIASFGPQVMETRWAGAGTFKELLQSEENLDFEIATTPSPGYLYDPKRHELPTESPVEQEKTEVMPPEWHTLVSRIHQATGTPDLTPAQYGLLFTAIAEELRHQPYNLTRTSKSVRDRVIEQGESISRANVSFVLKGIIYKGHRFSKRENASQLARIFANSVLARCEDVELELTEAEQDMVEAWIVGAASRNGK
ncbi:MAG: NYN domain-containing protein [Caldilineales bacterium]|nr:NYN domain-containing protein [Caldilineales bacterium]